MTPNPAPTMTPDPILADYGTSTSTLNYLNHGYRYEFEISDDKTVLLYRVTTDSGPLGQTPPGLVGTFPAPRDEANKSQTILKVSADNDRVLIVTQPSDPSKPCRLYWRCLIKDTGGWVKILLAIVQTVGRLSLDGAQFQVPTDLPTLSGDLTTLGNSVSSIVDWIRKAKPDDALKATVAVIEGLIGCPINTPLWNLISGGQLDKQWIESPPFLDGPDSAGGWATAYSQWADATHDPTRTATAPYLANNGWNSLEFRTFQKPYTARQPNCGLLANWSFIDIAVGNWNQTVVTYYALVKTDKGDVGLYFIDEEPVMKRWNRIPWPADATLDESSRIAASHSVVAVAAKSNGSGRLYWTRMDAHHPTVVDVWPINWSEHWFPELLDKRYDAIGGTLLWLAAKALGLALSLGDPPFSFAPVSPYLNPMNYPGLYVLNAINYGPNYASQGGVTRTGAWHWVELDWNPVALSIDVSLANGAWPVPSPADLPGVLGQIPGIPEDVVETYLKYVNVLFWLNQLVALVAAQQTGVQQNVGIFGENPITPNGAYPIAGTIIHFDGPKRYVSQFQIPQSDGFTNGPFNGWITRLLYEPGLKVTCTVTDKYGHVVCTVSNLGGTQGLIPLNQQVWLSFSVVDAHTQAPVDALVTIGTEGSPPLYRVTVSKNPQPVGPPAPKNSQPKTPVTFPSSANYVFAHPEPSKGVTGPTVCTHYTGTHYPGMTVAANDYPAVTISQLGPDDPTMQLPGLHCLSQYWSQGSGLFPEGNQAAMLVQYVTEHQGDPLPDQSPMPQVSAAQWQSFRQAALQWQNGDAALVAGLQNQGMRVSAMKGPAQQALRAVQGAGIVR